jgi:hypothetical protein
LGNPNIAEAGKPYQFKPGCAPGPGRPKKPIIDRALELLEKAGVEEDIARLWIEDARAEHPIVRMNARRDLMDRFVGKPAQSLNVTVDDFSEPDVGF